MRLKAQKAIQSNKKQEVIKGMMLGISIISFVFILLLLTLGFLTLGPIASWMTTHLAVVLGIGLFTAGTSSILLCFSFLSRAKKAKAAPKKNFFEANLQPPTRAHAFRRMQSAPEVQRRRPPADRQTHPNTLRSSYPPVLLGQ